MADTVKKSKAPAKPRAVAAKASNASAKEMKAPAKASKLAAKKTNGAQAARPAMPSREEIERLAKSYWAQRGYVDGYAEQDWLRAEQELHKMAS